MKTFSVDIYPIRNGEFFTTYVHPLTKKKIREKFSSRQDAVKFKSEIEKSFSQNRDKNLSDMSVSELMTQFNIEQQENSFMKYSKSHMVDFVETFGDFRIDEVTSETLKIWLDQIQRENNLKSISMRSIKCSADGFFKYLIEKEIISDSPLTEIYYAKSTPPLKSRNLLSVEENKELLNALKEFSPGYLYPLIRMYAETGAKTSEVADLLWKNVDLERGEVHFEQTIVSRERTLKLSEEMVQLLKRKKASKGHVFLTYYGEPFSKNKIRRALLEFRARGTFKRDWNPNDLRHSYAVNFLKKGGTIKELQYILGHENVYQTKQLYKI